MATVVRLNPATSGNRVHRLLAALPDETEPLIVNVPGHLAANIRRAAGWAGQSPEQQAIAFLESGFGGGPA